MSLLSRALGYIKTAEVLWSLTSKAFLSYQLHKVKLTGMAFDLDLWPTDLNINRGHLLVNEYQPTKFEARRAKPSWVISCTRWSGLAWPLNLTFNQGISTYQVWSLRGKAFWSYQLHKVKWTGMTFDLGLSDLNINRGHLLIKDDQTTKFEAWGAKPSWIISCTRWSTIGLTFDPDLWTWVLIGVIYSSRDYHPTKFEAWWAKPSWVISCTRWNGLAWPFNLTFDQGVSIYQVRSLRGKALWSYQLHKMK